MSDNGKCFWMLIGLKSVAEDDFGLKNTKKGGKIAKKGYFGTNGYPPTPPLFGLCFLGAKITPPRSTDPQKPMFLPLVTDAPSGVP